MVAAPMIEGTPDTGVCGTGAGVAVTMTTGRGVAVMTIVGQLQV